MRYIPVLVALLPIASLTLVGTPAIANPTLGINRLGGGQLSRLSRDLIQPSPSEDFFRQGKIQMERELQRLAQQQGVLSEEILKVKPDPRQLEDVIPRDSTKVEPRQQ